MSIPCAPAEIVKKTGRTKIFYARETILAHLENLEDIYLATQSLQRSTKTYSAQDVKRELGQVMPERVSSPELVTSRS